MTENKQQDKYEPNGFVERDVLGMETVNASIDRPKKSHAELEVPIENDITLEFPPLVKRVQALIFDMVIVFSVFGFTGYIFNLAGEMPTSVKVIVFCFMVFVYEPLFVKFHKVVG